MKYPQLVSTRAVNAISDWLVSQLELLGVEAPLIYSRLLLSLLHSSVQINDPIEFNNLETYLASRKGNKRNPPCDTDTLKKITAVQCLMDTVSSEQEISKIENLVEELCEKLNDIEKEEEDIRELSSNKLNTNEIEIEDPRKRYYRAFPALSKEMEDSVWIRKGNVKALTWPSGNSVVTNSTSNSNSLNNIAGVKRKPKRRRNQAMPKNKIGNTRKTSYGCSNNNSSPTWDTDFEGSWEMGHDLIKEFLIKQNNRNRSTSESGAYSVSSEINFEKRMKPMITGENENNLNINSDNDNKSMNSAFIKSSEICQPNESLSVSEVSLSNNAAFISDEGYSTNNEPLTSLSEIDYTLNNARRLYQRDVSDDSLNLYASSDFAQFKAKFNSSVEALWKNNDTENSTTFASSLSVKNENLDDFWTNYYNHHYDKEKLNKKNPSHNSEADETDYFSTSANVDIKYDKINLNKDASEKSFAPVAIFWKNSIWSDNSNKNKFENNADNFYENLLGSSYKNDKKINNNFYDVHEPSYSFNISKWSECSIETPFIPSSSTMEKTKTSFKNLPSLNVNNSKDEINENMLKTSYLHNYKNQQHLTNSSSFLNNSVLRNLSTNQNQQSVPLSLSDLFTESDFSAGVLQANKSLPIKKPISLVNHSLNSKFVEYSEIKSIYTNNLITKEHKNSNENKNCQSTRSLIKKSSVSSPLGNTRCDSNCNCDEEYLLVSDRTHFRPIKQSYADGYVFDIPSNLDDVKFERSESGFFYLESEKYLEYKKLDTVFSDDDNNILSHKSEIKVNTKCKKNDGIALKFRVKQTEKYCQTGTTSDDDYIMSTYARNINNDVRLNSVGKKNSFKEFCAELLLTIDAKRINSYALKTNNDQFYSQFVYDHKNCQKNDNIANTIWDLHPVPDSARTSVKASLILKDELNKEADEIMSDLKYMQNLYIDSDWEDENIDNDYDEDIEMLKEKELYKAFEKKEIENKSENYKFSATAKSENKKSSIYNDNLKDVIHENIFGKENKEGKIKNNNVIKNKNNDVINIGKYVDDLWSNVENIIWKEEKQQPVDKVNKISLSQIGNSEVSSFFENLNWKYSNLAKIWQNLSDEGEKSLVLSSLSPKKISCNKSNSVSFEEFDKENETDYDYLESDDEMDDENIDSSNNNNNTNAINIEKFVSDIWLSEKKSQVKIKNAGISSYFENLDWKHSNLAEIWNKANNNNCSQHKNSNSVTSNDSKYNMDEMLLSDNQNILIELAPSSPLSEVFCYNNKSNNNTKRTNEIQIINEDELCDYVAISDENSYSSDRSIIDNNDFSNAENIIWKKEIGQQLKKNSDISSFFENLNWKHSNLAKIWNKNSSVNNNNCSELRIKTNDQSDKLNQLFKGKQTLGIRLTKKKNGNSDKIFSVTDISDIFIDKKDENHNNQYLIKQKSTNRKRRHSASSQNIQNYKINDINCDDGGYDNMKVGMNINESNNYNRNNIALIHRSVKEFYFNNSPKTIITCKYWTRKTTPPAAEEISSKGFLTNKENYNDDGNNGLHFDGGFPTLALNASSILNQVAMVTRPLTR